MVIAVPQVVVVELLAVDCGLHDEIPVVFSKSPKVTMTCSNGDCAQLAALTVLKHTEIVSTRDSVDPVAQEVEHQASTD